MFNLKAVGRILVTAFEWAIAWGIVGAVAGVVMILVEPDTGHIPRSFVPVMVGVPSAVFGFATGLLFACVVAPAAFRDSLGVKGQVLVGGIVGGAAGIVFMKVLAHSVVTVLSAALLGAALAIRYARSERNLGQFSSN